MMKKLLVLLLLTSNAFASYTASTIIADPVVTSRYATVTAAGALKVDTSTTTQAVTQSGTWTVGRTWSLLNSTDSVNAVQSGTWNLGNISGTITLPTGASTSANQSTANTTLSAINTQLGGTLATSRTWTLSSGTDSVAVTGTFWQATQPVSGTFWQTTQPVSIASLPLPSGGATAAFQTSGNASLSAIDTKLGGTLAISAASLPLPTGAATEATLSTLNGKITAVDTDNVMITASALPSGASTSAKQDTGNTSIASIDTKTPALGQALAADSVPVVLTASQLSTLTPLTTVAATQSGSWTTGRTWSLLNSTDSVNAVQSGTWNLTNISGTISLPTGASTETTLSAMSAKLPASLGAKTGALSFSVVPNTDTAFPVTGTFWQATQPVSVASLPLPSGGSTSANQATEITSLASIDTKTPALGQALAAASVPVVLTASQLNTLTPLTTVAATQSGTWNVTNVSGTVSLPTGASTLTAQTTGNNSLSSIDGKITAVNTGAVVVSSSALPSGAATLAKQPALGTAGTASADVITVQGIASMTALKVDGSAVTQPTSMATGPAGGASGNSPGSTTVSTVATITAPSNAMGFILMNLDTSTANIRYRIGGTAAVGSGQQLQPARDTGFIPCKANISIIAESGTQNYDIQWVIQ